MGGTFSTQKGIMRNAYKVLLSYLVRRSVDGAKKPRRGYELDSSGSGNDHVVDSYGSTFPGFIIPRFDN